MMDLDIMHKQVGELAKYLPMLREMAPEWERMYAARKERDEKDAADDKPVANAQPIESEADASPGNIGAPKMTYAEALARFNADNKATDDVPAVSKSNVELDAYGQQRAPT